MFKGLHGHTGWALLAAILFITSSVPAALALDLTDNFSLAGYADFRVVAPPSETSWLSGGLGKFRYGGTTQARFAEAVAQGDYRPVEDMDVIGVLRAEPQDRDVVDALEAYVSWHPQSDGDLSFSTKA